MKQYFDGSIQNGRIKLKNPQIFNQLVASFKHGTEIRLTLGKPEKLRSENENRYYHAVPVKILAEHFGEFPKAMHHNLAWMFLKVQDLPYPKRRSTTTLTPAEFEDYTEKIRVWALTEHKIRIPLPNEFDLEL